MQAISTIFGDAVAVPAIISSFLLSHVFCAM